MKTMFAMLLVPLWIAIPSPAEASHGVHAVYEGDAWYTDSGCRILVDAQRETPATWEGYWVLTVTVEGSWCYLAEGANVCEGYGSLEYGFWSATCLFGGYIYISGTGHHHWNAENVDIHDGIYIEYWSPFTGVYYYTNGYDDGGVVSVG